MPFRDLKGDKKRQKEQVPKRRTMKQKQQSWVMTGLKALKAPSATCHIELGPANVDAIMPEIQEGQ